MSEPLHVESVYINSRNRIAPNKSTDSNFSFLITLPDDNFDRVVLLQASIPVSYEMVNPRNNRFILEEGGVGVTVELGLGNYKVNNFRAEVAAKLNAASPNGFTYNITFDEIRSRFTYLCSNSAMDKSFIMPKSSPFELMGFPRDSINMFDGGTLLGPNHLKFRLEDVIYINSSICVGSANAKFFSGNNLLQGVFTPLALPNSTIYFRTPDAIHSSRQLRRPNKEGSAYYNFTLTNEDGEPIDLNGLNIVLQLGFFQSSQLVADRANDIRQLLTAEMAQSPRANGNTSIRNAINNAEQRQLGADDEENASEDA